MNIAIIPARSDSKRIKNKNIKLFLGKPIISYVIDVLKKSKIFNKVIVSTNSNKIAEISKKFGADILFKRPIYLSTDHASTIDVIRHSINWLNKNNIYSKNICCVYPTSVFLKHKNLKSALKKLTYSKCDFVFSAKKFSHPLTRSFEIKKNRVLMNNKKFFNKRTQDLNKFYHDAAQFYWGKKDSWIKKKIIFSKNSTVEIIPEFESVDIDNIEDWKFAEKLYLLNKKK